MPHFQSVAVMLSCLSLVCHGKRCAASFNRAAIQQVISRAHDQQVGKNLLGKFAPLPSFVAGRRMKKKMNMLDTNALGSSNSRHALRPMLTQRRKALPLGEQSPLHRMDICDARNALQSLLGDPPKAVPFLRPGANWRHYPVGMNAAVLERQRAPPAPPGGSGGWGGDDNGDGDSSYLSCMTKDQAEYVLTDWIARANVYKMTGFFGNAVLAERYVAVLKTFERLVQEVKSDTVDGPGQIIAVGGGEFSIITALHKGPLKDLEEVPFKERAGKIYVVASVRISHDKGLVINDVAVNPAEVNDPSSRAERDMRFAIETLAKTVLEE